MIYELIQTIQDDTCILADWIKQSHLLANHANEDQRQRVQGVAIRALAFVAMTFACLWAVSLVVSVISASIITLFKLALPVALYVYAHDIFFMSQKASQNKSGENILVILSQCVVPGRLDREEALALTTKTLMQPVWMWWMLSH